MARIKLGLGTAQIGLPYGNQVNAPLMPEGQAHALLRSAVKSGVRFFDTAIAYAESEQRIGSSLLGVQVPDLEISTKIPAVAPEIWRSEITYSNFLSEALAGSRLRLGIPSHGLLQFHQSSLDFLGSPHIGRCMKALLDRGLCAKVGISVYEPNEALAAIEIPGVSAVQIPISVVDQRFLGLIRNELASKCIIARSILLQGVLVTNAPLPPVKKEGLLGEARSMLHMVVQPADLKAMSLRYVFGNLRDSIDLGLIGANSVTDLEENLSISELDTPISETILERAKAVHEFVAEHKLYDPRTWNN